MTSICCATLVLALLCVCSGVRGQSYTIEALFLVDDETVKSYMRDIPGIASDAIKRAQAIDELNKDITYTIHETNRLFASLKPGLDIELYVRYLEILSTNVFPPTAVMPRTLNGINTDVALTNFDNYLQSKNYYNIYKYDLALLWTGFDIYSNPTCSTTAGYAHVGKVCDPKLATGIAEFTRTYRTALTTAHEIGHILGLEHSGYASTNIMTPLNDPSHVQRWFFSTCSTSDIKDTIATLSTNCLLTTDASSTKPILSYGSYTGQILDVDAICQRAQNGLSSYMCKSWSLYNNSAPSGDSVCTKIYCTKPGTQYCMSTYASDGMVCSSGKRCSIGKCLEEYTAPTDRTTNCVFGDQKMLEFKSLNFIGTCYDFVKTMGASYCYQPSISERCCATCNAYSTGIAGCEYGDKSTLCTQYSKAAMCPYNRELCCGYCNGYVGKRSVGVNQRGNAPRIILQQTDQIFNDTVYAINDHGKDRDSRKED